MKRSNPHLRRYRLIRYPSLGSAELLDPTEPPPGSAATEQAAASQAPERAAWFLADDFDWLRLITERDRLLRGAGGFVPASLAYIDPHNAIEYLAYLSHCPLAFEPRTSLPLVALVDHIAAELRESPLQILALGAGDGQTELRVAYGLLDQIRTLHVELWLIDQSLPLLCVASRRATALLGAHPRIRLRLLAEDVQQLARHAALANPDPARPRRLYTLFGGTLADLDNEARFLRHGLLNAAPGDLLLVDIQAAAAPADKPDEISRRERLLREPVPALLRDWLTGSLWRVDREVGSVELRVELDPHGEFSGSYSLPVVAQVRSRSRIERRFVLYQFKRHVPEALVAFLRDCGWALVAQIPYGQDRRSLALLCRRMSEESAAR